MTNRRNPRHLPSALLLMVVAALEREEVGPLTDAGRRTQDVNPELTPGVKCPLRAPEHEQVTRHVDPSGSRSCQMARRVARLRSRTRAGDTARRSIEIWNIGKRLSVSLIRDLEHREKPRRVVGSRSRSRQIHSRCRLVEIQISSKPLGIQLYRNPDLVQATRHAVVSKSRSRPSHQACSCIGIQISSKPPGMRLYRDPDLVQATLRYRSYDSDSAIALCWVAVTSQLAVETKAPKL